MNDLRYAVRGLRRSPGFAAAAILTLALGIGANTAIFSVVDAYLLRPLPYPHAERLVTVSDVQPGFGEAPASFLEWRDLEEAHGGVFEALAASFATNVSYVGGELPERVRLMLVGGEYFEMLGLGPLHGRLFAPEERIEGGPPVVVLSEWFWRSWLGGRPDAVGDMVHLDDLAYTVVGVVPEPAVGSGVPIAAYAPLPAHAPWRDRGSHFLSLMGRLRTDLTLDAARAELDQVATRLQEEQGTTHGWSVAPLRDRFAGPARTLLLTLFGAVGLVLLIATANVANLLLVRSAGRRSELAIRTALGASRGRLLRLLFVESLVLGCAGAAVGAAFGVWGTPLLADALPGSVPRLANVSVDLRVLVFTGSLALASAILIGLAPALFELRRATLGAGSPRALGGSREARRARDALVVAELAVALVLLVGAGLMIQSFQRLISVDPGFRVEGLLTMSTSLPGSRYPEPAQRLAFIDDVADRIAALPGVRGVAAANNLPLTGLSLSGDLTIDGRPLEEDERPHVEKRIVSEGYFEALGIPLRRGRRFTRSDHEGSPPVVMINETMAARLWPDGEALGQRIRSLTCGECWEEVVGVVADVRERAMDQPAPMQVYYPVRQVPRGGLQIVVRAAGDPAGLVPSVRRAVAEVDPLQPVYNPRTMRDVVGLSVADRRLATFLLSIFAGLALVLAAVGVSAVISYAVARRTREIGLRIALGSAPGEAVRLILGQGMRLAAIGTAIGIPVAVVLARVLRAQLYGIDPGHPATYVAGAVGLGLVALVSCYLPARDAARVDPMEALRHE